VTVTFTEISAPKVSGGMVTLIPFTEFHSSGQWLQATRIGL
jgi:hypothetical protein